MPNDLTNYIQPLLAQGIVRMREMAVLPRIVNSAYSAAPGAKFSTVEITVPSAIVATDVVPGHVAPDTGNIAPTLKMLVVDQWKEAAFTLTDSDLMKVSNGVIPDQANEAIRAIVNAVESHIWSKALGVSYVSGTPGTTPFAVSTTTGMNDMSVYAAARAALNKRNVPKDQRIAVVDNDAEANLIQGRGFQDASWRGDTGGIIDGQIGYKLGANWLAANTVPTRTTTPFTAGAVTVNGAHAAGATNVSLAKATTATPLIVGDVLVIAGKQYAVATAVTLAIGNTIVSLARGLEAALAGGETVTKLATFVANVLMHRDALAFVNRPLSESNPTAGAANIAAFDSIVDPVSGLTLRLELTREHKQWRWSYDMLWGAALIRDDFAQIMAG